MKIGDKYIDVPPNMLPVAIGAACGGMVRHFTVPKPSVTKDVLQRTALVNIGGSFALGLFQRLPQLNTRPKLSAGLTAGFCGGLTTFSTFMGQNVDMFNEEVCERAGAYSVASCLLGLLAVSAGRAVGSRIKS